MKKIIYALSLAVFFAMSSVASAHINVSIPVQSNESNLEIGPFIGFKAGMNVAKSPEGSESSISFNIPPDFGIGVSVPVKNVNSFSTYLELSYNTSTFILKPENNANDDNTGIWKVHYFAIAPSVIYKSIIIGLNFGIPLSASMSNLSGTFDEKADDTDEISTLIEMRLGASLPLIVEKSGNLNLNIIGAYMLNGMDKNDDSSFNPQVASLSIGVAYLFNTGL